MSRLPGNGTRPSGDCDTETITIAPQSVDVFTRSRYNVSLVASVASAKAERFNDLRITSATARMLNSLLSLPAAVGEWSRGDASDIDGQAERSKRAGANESMLSEFKI